MKAWLLKEPVDLSSDNQPLISGELPDPEAGPDEVVVKISVCGVCHTELDEIEGRIQCPSYPVVPGHQVVGRVVAAGQDVRALRPDDRVGIGWFYSSCGICHHCRSGFENLCPDFKATGMDVNGGYAAYIKVPATSAFTVPDVFTDSEAAPLLCAGAIGFRSLRLADIRNGDVLGLTGFGASGHLVLKLVRHRFPDSPVFVFARSEKERSFALSLGAKWAGDTDDQAPQLCRAIIDTTPVWKPVVKALKQLEPGGRLVINAIRKEAADQDILLQLNYPEHLWMEKEIKSVANVARDDIGGFLKVAAEIPIKPEIQEYPFKEANRVLMELKKGLIKGAKVLMVR